MKFALLLMPLLFLSAQRLPPLVGPLIPDETGTVTGIVRRADTGRALAEAQVFLTRDRETAAQAVTDVNGRFTIKASPGDYVLSAQREGYFRPADENPGSARVSRDVTVIEGQEIGGVIFEMIPGATISGRVRGLTGQMAALATVEALQATYTNGRRILRSVHAVQTDDLGEYRMFWIPPGEYYVRAQYRLSGADRTERYTRVFFPDTLDEDVAPGVVVAPGGEVSAIDLRVPILPDAGVTLSGRVTTADALLADKVVTTVYVVPRDRTVTVPADASDAYRNEAADTSQGQFVIHGVPPGEYTLFPVVKDSEGQSYTARISVDVAEEKVENLSAALSPPVEVRGRITVDGKAPPEGSTIGRVFLTSIDGLPESLLAASGSAARVPADPKTGEFVIPHVTAGRYAVGFATALQPASAYVADIRHAGNSVFDVGITIGAEQPEPLEVAVRTEGLSLVGTVFDPPLLNPISRATVVLVPAANSRRKNFALYRTTTSLRDGTFSLYGIAPGEYKVFAWESVTAGAWENEDFLRRFEDRGTTVRLEANALLGPVAPEPVRVKAIPR
jgi:hypothetical protein